MAEAVSVAIRARDKGVRTDSDGDSSSARGWVNERSDYDGFALVLEPGWGSAGSSTKLRSMHEQ